MCDQEYDFVPEFRSTNIPRQKLSPAPELAVRAKMGSGVFGITSFPPLGQVTQLQSKTISFLILLEVDEANASDSWEVSLWHSSAGPEWREAPLARKPFSASPRPLHNPSPSKLNLYFHAELPASSPLGFTLKYRNGLDQAWRWARDEHGVDDGLVLLCPEKPRSLSTTDLSDIIVGLNPSLKVNSVTSQSPGTDLWTIEAPIGPAQDEKSAYSQIQLGTPWGEYIR